MMGFLYCGLGFMQSIGLPSRINGNLQLPAAVAMQYEEPHYREEKEEGRIRSHLLMIQTTVVV
jgi:hypothetical protein